GPPYFMGVAVAASRDTAHIACALNQDPAYLVCYWRPQGDVLDTLCRTGIHPAIAVAGSDVYVTWDDARDGPGYSPEIYFRRHRRAGNPTTAWDDGDSLVANNNSDTTKRISFAPGASFHSALAATPALSNHIEMIHSAWLDARDPALNEIYYSSSSKISDWRDFRNPGNLVPHDYDVAIGDCAHGTGVASVAAGCLVARTATDASYNPCVGVAHQAVLAIAAAPYPTPEAEIIERIKWLVDSTRCDVINLSLGSVENVPKDASSPVSQYVDWATARGRVVCVAAGNSGPLPGPDSLG
ncbi:MAG: S8 family serine peptidase, partial [candidate division WOR-3 bacterium]